MAVFLYRVDLYQNVTEDGETFSSITHTWYHAPVGTRYRDELLEDYGDRNDGENQYKVTLIAEFDDDYDFPLVLRALQIADGEIKTREWEAMQEPRRGME